MLNKETVIIFLLILSFPIQFPIIQLPYLKNLYVTEYLFIFFFIIYFDKNKFHKIFKKLNFIDYSVIIFLVSSLLSFFLGSNFKYLTAEILGYIYVVCLYFYLKTLFDNIDYNKIYIFFIITSSIICVIGLIGILSFYFFDLQS